MIGSQFSASFHAICTQSRIAEKMGYRDDLYHVDNIIGYTGVLNSRPSVYFFWAANSAYGHITQEHPDASNIGREEYNADVNYLIENTDTYSNNYPVGEFRQHRKLPITGRACVEWQSNGLGGRESFHTSRNLFVPVRPSQFFPNATVQRVPLAVCAIAVREFQFIKPMYA